MALSTNGKWTISNLAMSIAMFLLSFWFLYLTTAVHELEKFAAKGDRFTVQDAAQMERRLREVLPPRWLLERMEKMEREDERLQLQIDRLEGHKTKGYTEDQ